MAPLSVRAPALVLAMLIALAVLGACSPEASRARDGGPGADPGNKRLVARVQPVPRAADTTLWPGRNPAPVERLARGEMPPPAGVTPGTAPGAAGSRAVTPDVPATGAQQRTFDQGRRANPRRPTSRPR